MAYNDAGTRCHVFTCDCCIRADRSESTSAAVGAFRVTRCDSPEGDYEEGEFQKVQNSEGDMDCDCDKQLVTSIAQYVETSVETSMETSASSNCVQVLSGPVFRRQEISATFHPLSWQMLIQWPSQTCKIDNLSKELKIMSSIMSKVLAATVSFESSESIKSVDEVTDSLYAEICISKEDNTSKRCIGYVHVVPLPTDSANINFCLDLIDISCFAHTIPDQRVFFSNDPSNVQQLATLQLRNASTYKPVSLYPMTFTHDMSFWESETWTFDLLTYCDIVRDVAGDGVVAVQLLDTYTDPGSGRRSRCYRLTFQSVDGALSYDTSWQLQSLIRLRVRDLMHVELR